MKKLICLVVVALLLAGCSSGNTKQTADADPKTQEIQQENVLVVGIPGDIEDLDPHYASFIRSSEAVANVYDQLTTFEIKESENGLLMGDAEKPTGSLLENIELLDDNKTYIMTLKKGIKLHSGREMTTKDVEYSYRRGMECNGGAAKFDLGVASVTKPIEVIDDYTFKIFADDTNPFLLSVFQMGGLSIVDSETFEANATADDPWAESWAKKNGSGSGPWMLESWTPGVEIIFKANKDYWGQIPGYDKMIWKIIPSVSNQIMMLKNGELNVVAKLPAKEVESLKNAEGLKVWQFPSQNQCMVMMNNNMAPFDNKLVRQAVALAIPYEEIIESVYYDSARLPKSPIPVGSPGHSDDGWKYDTDMERAKELLKKAGYENGFDATLYISNADATHETLAILVQNALSQIGGRIEIQKMNPAPFHEQKYDVELQFYIDEALAWVDDPSYILDLTWVTGSYSNSCGYSNTDFDDLCKKAKFMTDKDARNELYRQAQVILMDDAPAAFIAQPAFNIVMDDKIDGYVQYFDELVRYNTMRPQGK